MLRSTMTCLPRVGSHSRNIIQPYGHAEISRVLIENFQHRLSAFPTALSCHLYQFAKNCPSRSHHYKPNSLREPVPVHHKALDTQHLLLNRRIY